MRCELNLLWPDDWHIHLRDNAFLERTVPDVSLYCKRAIVMPNLKSPITSVDLAKAYQERIQAYIPKGADFTPLMTLYFTPTLTPEEIQKAKKSGLIKAIKYYPAGATTHSSFGIQNIASVYPLLEVMQDLDLPLLIHGEVVDPQADVFDREKLFIENTLTPLTQDFPRLRIVLEHITTQTAVAFVEASSDKVAATITAHHLLYDRNALFQQGINPHYYCLPILKRSADRRALLYAATSGHPRFFLGTDSAPHARETKECSHGCAGIYTAHAALSFYAKAFEECDALDKLEAFASHFGADFYQLPRNTKTITLIRKPWEVPDSYPFGDQTVIPLGSKETLMWQISR